MMTGAPGGAAPSGGAEPNVFPTRLLPAAVLVGAACALGAGVAPGRGRIILHTFRVQHRGQTWGTFKLLFDSIFYGAALAPPPPSAGGEPGGRRGP